MEVNQSPEPDKEVKSTAPEPVSSSTDSTNATSPTSAVHDDGHHTNPPLSAMPSSTPPKRNNSVMLIFAVIVLVVIVFGTYIATKSTTNKTTTKTVTVTSPVAIAPAQVSITAKGFVPATITVKVNQAVVWTNADSAAHQVNSDPYPSNNGLADFNDNSAIAQNTTWAFVFSKAGTFTYHDNLNPYTFKGTVIVTN